MVLHQVRNDDLNGDPEAVTCVITVNGRGIEVDLAERSMQKLVKALEPFWQVGSETAYDIQRKGVGKRPERTREENRMIREWAVSQGLVSPQARGLLAQSVVDAYNRQA